MSSRRGRGRRGVGGRGRPRGRGVAPVIEEEVVANVPEPPVVPVNVQIPQPVDGNPRPIHSDLGGYPQVEARQVGSGANELVNGERPPFTFLQMGAVGTILPFEGSPNENIEDWLAHYEWVATVHHWGQEITGMQLPVYLGGTAKAWYETLPIEDRKDYTRLRNKLGNES
jgi:hypothetical protein